MKRMKIVTLIGTRPEIIRLSRVISKLDEHCENIIVHTGQNYDYELNKIFFEDLKIRKPDYFLNCVKNHESYASAIGNIIKYFDEILSKLNPELVLTLGDTNSGLGVIAAKRRKIPIFHMEAGNRCFDQRVPEEINRKIIDHTSDINLTYSSIAKSHLIQEGFPSNQIIKIGSPMKEVLNYYKNNFENSKILNKFNLKKGNYFLISTHREENINDDRMFIKLLEMINFLKDNYKIPIVISLHPRTKNKLVEKRIKFDKNIKISKPLGYFDYMWLQLNSKVVLSDSGTITEEASIMKFHALNIRQTNERQEGMEEGAVMMVGLNINRISQGIKIIEETQNKSNKWGLENIQDYEVENVSDKVLRIIHSYTDYINHYIWHKEI